LIIIFIKLFLLFFTFLISQIVPLALFFVFFKWIKKIVGLKVIFFYLLILFFSNFLIGAFHNRASLIVSVSAMIEYASFSIFFLLSIQNKTLKNSIFVASIIFLSFELFLLYFNNVNFDFWAALFSTILIVIFSIFFFYEQINSVNTNLIIYNSYQFWIVVGCIIYLTGTLFFFLYTSNMKDRSLSPIWGINFVFEIIKNICFSIAFIVAKNNIRKIATQNLEDTNVFQKPL